MQDLEVELFLYIPALPAEQYLARLDPSICKWQFSGGQKYWEWENVWLREIGAWDRVDVLHSPFNFGLPWSSPFPRVLTLHDAIDQVYYRRRSGVTASLRRDALLSRFYHWKARRRADRIIAVSEYTKSDLVKHLKIPGEKITVVYEAADPIFSEPIPPESRNEVRERYGLRRPYVFYVGGWEQRKNIPFLLRAFAAAQLDGIDLVLAGGNDEQKTELQQLARSLGIDAAVRLIGWVTDAELPALYAEALCFVYPSEYEGFGLQLCEAMATGTPVLAARATCLPEILGDGGETFSFESEDELAGLLRRVAGEPAFRDELSARARSRSADFSWQRAAVETVEVYRRAIAEAKHGR